MEIKLRSGIYNCVGRIKDIGCKTVTKINI